MPSGGGSLGEGETPHQASGIPQSAIRNPNSEFRTQNTPHSKCSCNSRKSLRSLRCLLFRSPLPLLSSPVVRRPVVRLPPSPLFYPVFENKCLSNPSCLLAKTTIRSFMLPGNMQFSKLVSKLPRESKDNWNRFSIAAAGCVAGRALEAAWWQWPRCGRSGAQRSAGATASVPRARRAPPSHGFWHTRQRLDCGVFSAALVRAPSGGAASTNPPIQPRAIRLNPT